MSDERPRASTRRSRNSCLEILERFRRRGATVALIDVLAFLYVCENPGVNIRELAQLCAVSASTASRTARGLAERGAPFALPPFLGLLAVKPNPLDDRGRTLHLTQAGASFRDELEVLIAKAAPIVG